MVPLVKEKKFYQTHSQRPFISLTHQPNIDNSPINIYTGENGYNGVVTDATQDKNFETNFQSRMKVKSPLGVLKYETKLLKNKEFVGLTDPRKKQNKSLHKQNLLNQDQHTFVNNRIKLPSYAICLQANIEPKNFSVLKSYYELMARDSHLAVLNKRQLLAKIVQASTGRSQSQLNTSQLERSDLRPQDQTFHYADMSNLKEFKLSDPRSHTIVTMGNIRVKEFLDRRSLKSKTNIQPNQYASHLVQKQENTASMESVTTDCMRKSVVNFMNGLGTQQGYDILDQSKDDRINTTTDHMVSEKILPMVAMFESHRLEHQDDRNQTAQKGSSRSKKKQIDIKTTVYQHPERINTLKNGSSQYPTSLRLDCEEPPLEIGGSVKTLEKNVVQSLQISEIETSIQPKTFTEMKVNDDLINEEEIESYLQHLYQKKQVMKPHNFYFSCDNADYRENKRDSQRTKNSKLESLARRQKFLLKENPKDNILTIKKIAQHVQKDQNPKHHSVATSTTQIEEGPPLPLNQLTPEDSIDALAQFHSITIEKPITATSRISETVSDFDQLRLSAARKQMMAYVDNPVVSEIRVRSNQGIRKGYENITGKRYTKQGFQYLETHQAAKGEDYHAPPTDVRKERNHSSVYEQSEMNDELVRVSMYQVVQESQGLKSIEPVLVDSLSLSMMPKAGQEPFIVLQWGKPVNNYKFGDQEPEQNSLYRSKSRLKPRKVIKRPVTQMQHKHIYSYTNESSHSVTGIIGLPPPQNRHLYVNYSKITDRSVMSKTQINLFKVDLKNMNDVNTQIEICHSDLAKSVPSPLNANTTLTAFHNITSPQFAKEQNPSKVQTAVGGLRNPKSMFGENKMDIPYVPFQVTSRDVSMHSFKKSNNFNDDYSPTHLQPRDISQSPLGNYLSTERELNPTMMNSSNDYLTQIPQMKANVISLKMPKSESMEDVLLAHLSKPNTNFIKLKTEIHQENRKLAQSALAESAPIDLTVRNKKQNTDYILNQKQVAVNFLLQMEKIFNKRNPSVENETSVKHQSTQAFDHQDSQILAISDQNAFVDQHSKNQITQDSKVWKTFQKERTLRQKRFEHKNGTLIKNFKPKHSFISSSVIRD